MFVKEMCIAIKKGFMHLIISIFNCLPLKSNKIFLFSYYGSQYGCNPKYISEYILKNYPEGHFDLVWAFDHLSSKLELTGIRKVKTMSLKYFYELCTSKIIITNFRTTDLFRKREGQFYIQTWHSSLRLKQIEKDVESVLTPHYVAMAKRDSKNIDLLLSGCELSTNTFKRAFWYNGEILERGTPRNDIFFQHRAELKKETLKKLNIPDDSKIVLYAPTFRNKNNMEIYDLEYGKIIAALTNRFGGNWVFLVKLHPHLLAYSNKIDQNNSFVLDVTRYDDIQELLCISDCLISDYSSLIFDYSITKRPCFLYVPDLYEYINQDRPLYFEIAELPFITVLSNNDLTKEISQFSELDYVDDVTQFLTKIGSFEDGMACQALAERIEKICFQNSRGRMVNEAI